LKLVLLLSILFSDRAGSIVWHTCWGACGFILAWVLAGVIILEMEYRHAATD